MPSLDEKINGSSDVREVKRALRAYPKNPAALKATQAQEKWRKAR